LFFQTLGRDLPDHELDFILDGRKRSEILRHFLGNCPEPDIEEFGRRKDSILRQVQFDTVPLPGVVRTLRELYRNGTVLALATSASCSRVRFTLGALGLLHCFQVVVTGDDVVLGKPDSAIYRLARQRIEIGSAHLLAVEDAISGVRAASGAGLHCVGVALHETPETLCAAGAVHVVPDFKSVSADDLEGILLRCESDNRMPESAHLS